MMRSVW